jgi:hypothetical protein
LVGRLSISYNRLRGETIKMSHLKYDELVAAYYENLNENLRHFRGGPGFLETWVHDEDHGRSLLGIIDLAHGEGIAELQIELNPEVASGLDLEWLRKEISGMGALQLAGKNLSFRREEKPAKEESFNVHPAYRAALDRAARDIKYALHPGNALPEQAGEIWRTAASGGISLHLRLSSGGTITAGLHESAGILAPVLDQLVGIILGLPLGEAADHGLIRLEKALRSEREPPPVSGVITPENADPCFGLPGKLLRALRPERGEVNTWREGLPEWWRALSEPDRLNKAASALQASIAKLKLDDPGIEVAGIKGDHRFVISYPAAPANKYWHYHLIELERAVRKELGFAAELQCEDIADRNRRVERTNRSDA